MRVKLYIIAALSGALLLPLIVTPKASASEWERVYGQEFQGSSVPSDWEVRKIKSHLGSYLNYNEENVTVINNDYLELKTQRHCVSNDNEALNASNATEEPCPAGKITKYLSGRVQSPKIIDGSKPFRAEIRAKVNWNNLQGTRPSLWLRNSVDLTKCHNDASANEPYGELDVLEWYPSTPAYTWSASHITCFHSASTNTWKTRNFGHRLENRSNRRPASLANEWHVWAVEYDGEKVRYYVDDELVVVAHYVVNDTTRVNTIDSNTLDDKGRLVSTMPDEDFSKLGVDKSLIKKVFDDRWYFILNDYVEWKPELNPPASTARFPTQTFLVDYVRLYQKKDPQVPPTQPPSNSGNHNHTGAQQQNSPQAHIGSVNSNTSTDQLAETGDNLWSTLLSYGVVMCLTAVFAYMNRKMY